MYGAAMVLALAAAAGAITADEAVVVRDGQMPVLVYNTSEVAPPEGVDDHFARACYIHPLYGLDGQILTQDFPSDHYHHRGVFWAWPASTIGDRKIDVWALDGTRQHSCGCEVTQEGEKAVIRCNNYWAFDDAPDTAQVEEDVVIEVLPVQDGKRAIDFTLTFTNASEKTFTLRGAPTGDKGYGGFSYRPDATRKPLVFTTDDGGVSKDQLEVDTPWVDCAQPVVDGQEDGDWAGVAIFQHPSNPGFPHTGWLLRHYGFLGASWPHREPHAMAPGESVTLRYRLLIHRGKAADAGIAAAFEDFKQGAAS